MSESHAPATIVPLNVVHRTCTSAGSSFFSALTFFSSYCIAKEIGLPNFCVRYDATFDASFCNCSFSNATSVTAVIVVPVSVQLLVCKSALAVSGSLFEKSAIIAAHKVLMFLSLLNTDASGISVELCAPDAVAFSAPFIFSSEGTSTAVAGIAPSLPGCSIDCPLPVPLVSFTDTATTEIYTLSDALPILLK